MNTKLYFPMAVQFRRACAQAWNANCIRFDETEDVRIPLIPALDDPAACKQINDASLREQCRQLNTYRAAFRQVDTIAEVRADKELCRRVDGGPGAQACLKSLAGYSANPRLFEDRLPLRMETGPIEKALILTPIAGMFVIRSMPSHLDPFRETACYSACYSAGKKWRTAAACVNVWWAVAEEDRRIAASIDVEGYTKAAERTEVFEGNTITTVDLPKYYVVVWPSGARVVKIEFYLAASYGMERARAAEASPEMRHALIGEYLLKYPSSN